MNRGNQVIDLRSRIIQRADVAGLARQQLASARSRLGMSPKEFCEMLTSVLGWAPTPEMIDSWETSVTPPGDVLLAVSLATNSTPHGAQDRSEFDVVERLVGNRFADVEAVFSSRSAFSMQMPPHAIFDNAKRIRACGLSMNLICQQYPDDRFRLLIEGGTSVQCLFLAPNGTAIKAREKEEGYPVGQLSALTALNIEILQQRVKGRLDEADQSRVGIATYDETIRFNIILIDDDLAIVQPYLHSGRGLESPTLLIRRQSASKGLYPMFEETFTWLWERGTPV